MNPAWNDNDDLDRALRQIMQAQPECARIKDLALRAAWKARQRERFLRAPLEATRYFRWHRLLSVAVAVVFVALVCFIYARADFQGDFTSTGSYVGASEAVPADTGVFQLLGSDDAVFAIFAVLLLLVLAVVAQQSLTLEHNSLTTWNSHDFLW